jgi:hypothetical protein
MRHKYAIGNLKLPLCHMMLQCIEDSTQSAKKSDSLGAAQSTDCCL